MRMRYFFSFLPMLLALEGCSVGIITATRTLQEPPFSTMYLAGDVTQAGRCVGKYWQTEATRMGPFWEVTTTSYRVTVTGNHGAGTPPIGLVIEFTDTPEGTRASAHVHPIYPSDDPRRTVTIAALNACKKR